MLASPFKCGGSAKNFDVVQRGANLVIRVDNADLTAKILVKMNGTVDSTHADMYLMGGESLTFDGKSIVDGSKISVLNVSGDPFIYYGVM